jgi:hypothetical protein
MTPASLYIIDGCMGWEMVDGRQVRDELIVDTRDYWRMIGMRRRIIDMEFRSSVFE